MTSNTFTNPKKSSSPSKPSFMKYWKELKKWFPFLWRELYSLMYPLFKLHHWFKKNKKASHGASKFNAYSSSPFFLLHPSFSSSPCSMTKPEHVKEKSHLTSSSFLGDTNPSSKLISSSKSSPSVPISTSPTLSSSQLFSALSIPSSSSSSASAALSRSLDSSISSSNAFHSNPSRSFTSTLSIPHNGSKGKVKDHHDKACTPEMQVIEVGSYELMEWVDMLDAMTLRMESNFRSLKAKVNLNGHQAISNENEHGLDFEPIHGITIKEKSQREHQEDAIQVKAMIEEDIKETNGVETNALVSQSLSKRGSTSSSYSVILPGAWTWEVTE